MNLQNIKIGIIGIGYVGLPLCIAFAKKFDVIAFDIDFLKINKLKINIDPNKEINKKLFKTNKKIIFTNNDKDLLSCNFYIITVPTPVKKNKTPDLSLVFKATSIVSKYINSNDIVVYESTFYPGTTEEFCVPIIEKISNLKFMNEKNEKLNFINRFYCGYSPERINPGDKKHTINDICKITSGSTKKIANFINSVYSNIIDAGTFKASSIKIAEAAKIIENTQRDLNIGLMNELSIIFNKMNIDTNEIINAASTKWNFAKFKPGLVGGHCIGVDPYYLTHKAKKIGYNPKIILSGRKVNNRMSNYVSQQIINKLTSKNIKKAKILLLGVTFKEDCVDIRNSQIINIYNILCKKKLIVDFFDPIADSKELKKMFKKKMINIYKRNNFYDLIVISVEHKFFKTMGINKIKKLGKSSVIIFDLKSIFKIKDSDFRL